MKNMCFRLMESCKSNILCSKIEGFLVGFTRCVCKLQKRQNIKTSELISISFPTSRKTIKNNARNHNANHTEKTSNMEPKKVRKRHPKIDAVDKYEFCTQNVVESEVRMSLFTSSIVLITYDVSPVTFSVVVITNELSTVTVSVVVITDDLSTVTFSIAHITYDLSTITFWIVRLTNDLSTATFSILA